MIYRRSIPVEFNHCDPAGIVFYPRYFEMTNSVVENFFAEALDYPFARMMAERHGIPTVRIEAEFRAPSRLGDRLGFALEVARLGRSSVGFALGAEAAGEQRMAAKLTLVWVSPEGKASAWPEALRARFAAFREAA